MQKRINFSAVYILFSLISSTTFAFWEFKGVCYDADWQNKEAWYGTPQAEKQLDRLKLLGVNAISITPFVYQKDVHQPVIQFRGIEKGLEKDIQVAKQKGFKIVLKPHIWSNQFWDGSGHWHGTIEMKSEANVKKWFQNYETMICQFAEIAQKLNVDVFVIGIEYEKMTRNRAKEWEKIITSIRKIYSGPLTYGAHGLEEAEHIVFWDKLDFIGINAYFSLTKIKDPKPSELLNAWNYHSDKLKNFSEKIKKTILLTEIGYSSVDGTAEKPYEWWPAGSRPDTQEQADCYEAMFRSLEKASWLKGIFIWKFKIGVTPWAQSGKEASESYFVFQDKPAEKIIQKNFLQIK